MSLRTAINAKCKDCIYDPLAGGTWRQQVDRCTSPECGLFDVRPRSSSAKRVDLLVSDSTRQNGQNGPNSSLESENPSGATPGLSEVTHAGSNSGEYNAAH